MQQHGAETTVIHEEQILEAIDQLRRRKARPDADRICNFLLRNYQVDARDTIADLHRLIEAEKVIQVDYKGNTSYRNASKWPRLQLYNKNRPDAFVKEKLNSALVAGSFAELIVEEPDYLDQGVPKRRLIDQLLNGISSPMSRKTIEDFLVKEVASGNLTKLGNGNYSLVGDADKNNRRYSSETSSDDKGGSKSSFKSSNSPEYLDFKETHNVDFRSKQLSPRLINNDIKKAVAIREPDSSDESYRKDNNYSSSHNCNDNKQSGTDVKKHDFKDNDMCYSNFQRSSKSERKQRLQVRADDSMDLEIDFEEFERSANSLKESLKKSREAEEQFSDDNKYEDEAGRSSTNTSPTPSNTVGGRSARRKRARKVFDPSDNNIVKRKRGRQFGQSTKHIVQAPQEPMELSPKVNGKDRPNRQCSLCAKTKTESLVACRDCTVRAHLSCIYSPEELLLKSGCSWQCERCKTCTACCETSESGNLVTCIICDDAYHHSCHMPKIPSKSSTKWKCCHCLTKCHPKQEKFSKTKEQKELKEPVLSIITSRPETPTNPQTLPPVLSPQVSPTRSLIDNIDEDLSMCNTIDPNIPDASDWTSEQVYQYFARLFGPKEAEVFRVQDIDGHSLLLMKRSDVLIGMDLLLGPALKIYRHVLKLQIRRDDTRFYWL